MSVRNPIIAPWPVGARGGLIDEKHRLAMGEAVFLFMWCLLRQTGQKDGWGIVLYGKPVTYEFIHEETGFPVRTMQSWMSLLVDAKYLKTERRPRGLVIYVGKAKKWFGNTLKTASGKTVKEPPKNRNSRQSDPQRTADHDPQRTADHTTTNGGSQGTQPTPNQEVKPAPNSKSLEVLNSTEIRHDACASGAMSFSEIIKSTTPPRNGQKTERELDERRRLLDRQKDELRRKGLLTA